MKSGIVYTCFSTDFLIEEADEWREECWKIIKERKERKVVREESQHNQMESGDPYMIVAAS